MRAYRLLPLLLCAGVVHAQMPAKDTVKNGKDHPLLSRFEGSKMVGYGLKEFDEVMLPAGKRVENKGGQMAFDSALQLEGKYTRMAYNYPRERSALEVMRNYQAALEKAGLKTVFACAKETCGNGFGEFFLNKRVGDHFIQGGEASTDPFNYGRNDERYLLAKGTRPDGSLVHVGVYSVAPVQDKLGGIYVEIVEAKAMEGGKVSANLNAADMAKGIAADGKVAVYGVFFDTDKTDVKPESKDALAEMAKLLQQDAKLKLYVVGHTDSQGALAHNLELSQKRAESVIKVLAADYKVDAKRLSAKGVASYSPAASNDAEAGREKNRRVELVKQ
ncbi:outer membrane protein OmpA [Janthinobacterium sp. HH01]|uniref:OmpA family protein n=1 Tax=Janthinobacterium sp. HH01 TaxID=1198452 RepID=UPI0002AEA0E9|nr:OmpA family protein [Janthinobacterium sp. HH01]ELX10479.1 outer membrane protein OmpA [Janthinobacterium sp. HH01]